MLLVTATSPLTTELIVPRQRTNLLVLVVLLGAPTYAGKLLSSVQSQSWESPGVPTAPCSPLLALETPGRAGKHSLSHLMKSALDF